MQMTEICEFFWQETVRVRRRFLMPDMLVVLSEGVVIVGLLAQGNVVVGVLLEVHDLHERLLVFVLPIF
jgi:hypothetical protein